MDLYQKNKNSPPRSVKKIQRWVMIKHIPVPIGNEHTTSKTEK